MILTVPREAETLWPTLGPQVAAWIRRHLVHGPGDIRGEPAKLDDDKLLWIYRLYEVYPQGHPQEGRRRFRRAAISVRKGSAKTEFAAWLAAAELHPMAPVRCIGWTRDGDPVGGGVIDPYIPLVAYTEEQSDELCYHALKVILELSPIGQDFDIGEMRIMRRQGDGKAVSLASAPDSRDGARTTFSVMDETHRWNVPRLRSAYRTMMANLAKRRASQPWNLEITTAPAPGEDSIAERTMEYARAIYEGRAEERDFFFFHRAASEDHDITTPEGARAAVLEASGPTAGWSDVDAIVALTNDPKTDLAYWQRVWLNRLVQAEEKAFNSARWAELANVAGSISHGALVTLGFDGARRLDATAIVATDVITGFQTLVAAWEAPFSDPSETWEVPELEVSAVMEECFRRWNVWRIYADPWAWDDTIAQWAGKWGKERVICWYTNRKRKAAAACHNYRIAIDEGLLRHDGNALFARHVANAHRRDLRIHDENGRFCWIIGKARHDSPLKIDAAMAGILSWEARKDALAEGLGEPVGESIWDQRAAAGEEVIPCL